MYSPSGGVATRDPPEAAVLLVVVRSRVRADTLARH